MYVYSMFLISHFCNVDSLNLFFLQRIKFSSAVLVLIKLTVLTQFLLSNSLKHFYIKYDLKVLYNNANFLKSIITGHRW